MTWPNKLKWSTQLHWLCSLVFIFAKIDDLFEIGFLFDSANYVSGAKIIRDHLDVYEYFLTFHRVILYRLLIVMIISY